MSHRNYVMQFSRESIDKVFREGVELFPYHYREVAHYKDVPLEPDMARYLSLEESGLLRVYAARDQQNTLCGYATFFIRSNIHSKSQVLALQDMVYISPKRRGFGHTFLKWCEAQLQIEGINVIYQYVTRQCDFGSILKRQGYELIEYVYAKRINDTLFKEI